MDDDVVLLEPVDQPAVASAVANGEAADVSTGAKVAVKAER